MEKKHFHYKGKFHLESGQILPEFELVYHTAGRLNENADNVIWVCHALTANSNVADWWPNMVGPGLALDTDKYFVICANILGSCYGSTGPLSKNPKTEKPYFHSFPMLTIRDLVTAHRVLFKELNIKKIHTLMGGSLGGQQALEWAILEPEICENLVILASNAFHSAWGIAFNETQRMCIKADQTWKERLPYSGMEGMKAARANALLSYRNYQTYKKTQSENMDEKTDEFKASSYQQYQGEKLFKRFNAYSYFALTKTMDSHNVARNRGGLKPSLERIKAQSLIIGISSDLLFPPSEQELMHKYIPDSELEIIDSLYGHDGFLIETEAISKLLNSFYESRKIVAD